MVEDPPVRFRRPAGMLPLPAPEPGGSLVRLREFCNLSAADLTLAAGWLLAALRGAGTCPELAFCGAPGSGKSACAGLLRMLIDPPRGGAAGAAAPRRAMAAAARQSHLLAFDNVSALPTPISDELCRLASGGGIAARRAPGDPEETVYQGCGRSLSPALATRRSGPTFSTG